MRERLIAAFLTLTLLTVLLYGVPRAFVRADVVAVDAGRELARTAQVVAVLVDTRREAGLPFADEVARAAPAGDTVLVRDADGEQVLAGPSGDALEQDALVASAGLAAGGTVEVRRARAVVRQDVVRALRPIVLTGLLVLAGAALLGVALANRLSRPFVRLAEQASALGSGQVAADLPTQRVREAELIAAALRSSRARITEMLARERDFARNASHQLRTPLTGMRLRVEDVAAWPETPDTVREELQHVLAEVDRLSDTVGSLLSFARQERVTGWERTTLADVLSGAAGRWQPLAAEQSRAVVVGTSSQEAVPLPRVAVEQVLDVLVDNALKHGRGTVTVRGSCAAGVVRVVVSDEGRVPAQRTGEALPVRTAAAGAASGEGIGLALCRDLAASLGGRLVLVHEHPTTFELLLPVQGPDGA